MLISELDRGRDTARFSTAKVAEFETVKKFKIDQVAQTIPIEKRIATREQIISNYLYVS
jgi:hypothetical protein